MPTMAIASGPCPSCGATVEFKAGASLSLVCPYCQHVVVRTDRDLVNLGKVADVVFNDTALAHGDAGVFQQRSFVVQGRVVMAHPAGGTWEEYFAVFSGGESSWIEEAMGRWYVLQQVTATAPPPVTLSAGATVDLGSYGTFTVDEVSFGTFTSAEGELPFSAAPGTVRHFADLSAPDGSRASIQQVDGEDAVSVYVGVETTFLELGVYKRSGERAEHRVATGEVKCPNCGGPLPARKDPQAARIVCPHCNALSDVKTHAVIAEQDAARAAPPIPIGREGMLDATRFTVIGYVARGTVIEGEAFGWDEYLLYNPDRGYAWLIADEGVWRLGVAVAGGEVDAKKFPDSVRYQGKNHRLRNTGPAEVRFVLGEFYWEVRVGEKVLAHDFESGSSVLSREASGTEVNWTFARSIPPSTIETAFGVTLEQAAGVGVPLDEPSSTELGSALMMVLKVSLVVLVVVMAARHDAGSCKSGTAVADDDSDDFNTPGRGSGGSGGLGGAGGK